MSLLKQEVKTYNSFSGKNIVIFSDEEFSEFLNQLKASKILENSKVYLIPTKQNVLNVENEEIKVHFLYRFIPKSLLERLKIDISTVDEVIYLGNDSSILRFVESVFSTTSLIYIGKLPSKSAILKFTPEEDLQKSATTFIQLINRIYK
ncbi:hypothetical protein JCM31826_03640 [Thermaurantimonas aggregans]|uniref:Uncharacterized protein n=1 Tax=Thermaurantimonas aggregans TaxID=2173829 RepID=A0A401XIN2_9FLAO|nr:hypothetical protein [Thermaurantimonas aggregans]MCX8148825.1 hypothetical protein [Thermaurantimonas aggregans]GCD76882.1 hypothetical protein JCM31826_03640 [Thermaurantimonas aggregans]